MTEPTYFRIKNWEKYQHRDTVRTKTMPWIKLHVSILDDEKIWGLTDFQFTFWIKLMLLSARVQNTFSTTPGWLANKLGISRTPDLALFYTLGLIEKISDSRPDSSLPRIDLDKKKKDFSRVDSISRNQSFSDKKEAAEMVKKLALEKYMK